MKYLDSDVKRPSASVSAIVDEGKHRRVRSAGIVHREHEHWPEDSNEQSEECVCGAVGRSKGCEKDEEGEV